MERATTIRTSVTVLLVLKDHHVEQPTAMVTADRRESVTWYRALKYANLLRNATAMISTRGLPAMLFVATTVVTALMRAVTVTVVGQVNIVKSGSALLGREWPLAIAVFAKKGSLARIVKAANALLDAVVMATALYLVHVSVTMAGQAMVARSDVVQMSALGMVFAKVTQATAPALMVGSSVQMQTALCVQTVLTLAAMGEGYAKSMTPSLNAIANAGGLVSHAILVPVLTTVQTMASVPMGLVNASKASRGKHAALQGAPTIVVAMANAGLCMRTILTECTEHASVTRLT